MTKGDINRLGKSITDKKGNLNDSELELLQNFRISFSTPLTETFKKIRKISSKVHVSSITAFRLKRIGTIINKIEREPKMQLSRMGDIAGIRCIFYNEKEVYNALEYILKEFEIKGKIRDYNVDPKPLGYKGVHVYVKDHKSGKQIEVQLRTIRSHNWATLVEITDLLYDLRLKELGFKSDEKFAKFHSLMSSEKELTKEEADLIYEVLKKNNFITKLGKTFLKNHSEVKKKWSKEDRGNSFFLIEASKDKIPDLKSFKTFEEAEAAYFDKYKKNQDAEIVLTSINKPNFKQISIAYANYILSYHNFISDIQPIISELAIEAIEESKFFKFKKIFKTYEELQVAKILEILTESTDLILKKFKKILKIKNKSLTKIEERKLIKTVKLKIEKHRNSHQNFISELNKNIEKKNFVMKFFYKKFLKKHSLRITEIILQKNT